jgi:hypothetical protein
MMAYVRVGEQQYAYGGTILMPCASDLFNLICSSRERRALLSSLTETSDGSRLDVRCRRAPGTVIDVLMAKRCMNRRAKVGLE